MNDEVEKKIIYARTVLGLYYAQLGLLVEAKAAVDPIVDLAIKRNYKRRVSQINVILAFYYHAVDEDYPKALEYYKKAIKIGEEVNDLLTLVLANNFMAGCLSDNCEFEKALSCFEKALGINIKANVQWGIATVKANLAAFAYCRQGRCELAYQTSQDALKISDESGDIYSKAHTYLAHGSTYYLKGILNKAEEHLLKASDFLQKSNLLIHAGVANILLGQTYFAMEDYKTSQKFSERVLSLWQHCSIYPSWIIWSKISITLAKVMNNEKDTLLSG